jgi:hypothetical protein
MAAAHLITIILKKIQISIDNMTNFTNHTFNSSLGNLEPFSSSQFSNIANLSPTCAASVADLLNYKGNKNKLTYSVPKS